MSTTTFIRLPSWWGRRAAHPENVMVPLDVAYAAAVLMGAGHGVEVLDVEASGASADEVLAALDRRPPDRVVLQLVTPAVPRGLVLARKIKDRFPGAQVVAVGQHATVLPATLLEPGSGVDLCLRGEYEQKLLEVVEAPEPGQAGLALPGDDGPRVDPTVLCVDDLDALPLPAHHLFASPRYRVFHPTGVRRRWRWGFVLSSRGCPHGCVYCSPTLRNSYGSRLRLRSVDGVLEELRQLAALGCTLVHFKDDVFTQRRDHVEGICEALLSCGLRVFWTAQTRPDLVDDRLLRLMKRAGCVTLGFGVESGSPRVLERLGKGLDPDAARRAFPAARRAGLLTVGFFMLGNPGETEADIALTHRLLMDVAPDIIQVAFFTAYPGATVFDDELLGRLSWEEFSHYNAPMSFSEVSDARLRWWQRKMYLDFIFRTGFLPRYLRAQAVPSLLNPGKVAELARLSLRFFGKELRP